MGAAAVVVAVAAVVVAAGVALALVELRRALGVRGVREGLARQGGKGVRGGLIIIPAVIIIAGDLLPREDLPALTARGGAEEAEVRREGGGYSFFARQCAR